MKKYKVTITETLERAVEVEAEDYEDAIDSVESEYHSGNIVLYAEDYTGTEFSAEELSPESEKSVKNRKDFSR